MGITCSTSLPEQVTLKSQLAEMAADPEVQDELRKIEETVRYCLGL